MSSVLYVGLFVSPVVYAPDMIPARGQLLYFLNPVAGTLLAFRSVLFASQAFPGLRWAYSSLFSLVVLFIGVRAFQGAERHFADKL